jgi:adenosylhomocysteinase
MHYHIKDIKLAKEGRQKIEWAYRNMPVLDYIKKDFINKKPLKGIKISACLHITAETANLMRVLKSGGADLLLCASNPLSTQDEIAASLIKDYDIRVFAVKGEKRDDYYRHLKAALDFKPVITLDDGADLISLLHSQYKEWAKNILGSMEETTTGVIRLKAMEKKEKLLVPIIAVNDAKTKNMFDNRYGTGQSTIDGIIRATDILIAEKTIVVAGYGWCGRGFAARARGMGARVIITEIDNIKALEAVMDGFEVMPMIKAAKIGDLFCTLTGNINVINESHFKLMKSGAILCNSGHFDVEINLKTLQKMSSTVKKNIRKNVDEYIIGKKSIFVLAEGRLVNLAAAEGHPASVMDMSFSTQALSAEFVVKNFQKLKKKIYYVPQEIEQKIAKLKLISMKKKIDRLTSEQKEYLKSWQKGT